MSQKANKFAGCYYFKLTTCFSPCCGPSSGHKGTLFKETIQYVIKYINLKLNEISLLFNILLLFMTRLRSGYIINHNNIIVIIYSRYLKNWGSRLVKPLSL